MRSWADNRSALCSKRTKAITGVHARDGECIAYDDAAPKGA